jgi:GNAT superfamily N-acetyltransferase
VQIRPTTAGDLPAQVDVFRAAIGELFRRHSFSPPDPPADAFIAQQRHLLQHDAERCHVADDGGRIVAFAAAFRRDETWYLASLFVHPEHQGRGIGRRLLEAAWGDARHRLTIADAIQPVSTGLYARAGLIPAAPVLNLAGTARAPDVEPTVVPGTATPAGLEALDRAAYGFPRIPDHAFWGARARLTVWLREGEPVAYAYVSPQGRIGPLAGATPEAAAAALEAELGRRAGEHATLIVPGSARELVEVALAGGLRFTDAPGLLLLSRELAAPRALAISGYSLL